MAQIIALIMPIVVAAVLVFIVAALLWMVAPHHKGEHKGLSSEDAVRAALGNPPPGLYIIPHAATPEARRDPAFLKKFTDGPVAFVTVSGRRTMAMGPQMVQSLIYYLVVSAIVAYVAGNALPMGTEYLEVFRLTGTVAWLAYGFSGISDSIWFSRPWRSTLTQLFDALVMGMVTAGVFGWLWK